jgi:hypothetical protein
MQARGRVAAEVRRGREVVLRPLAGDGNGGDPVGRPARTGQAMILLAPVLFLACLTPEERPERPCTACHGTEGQSAGPPAALGGATDPAYRGVGAHERHREPLVSREVPCRECHLVPERLDDPGHVDTEWPAEVGWGNGEIAALDTPGGIEPFDAGAQSCAVYCHSASGGSNPVPSWTGGQVNCGSCHGNPPTEPPHPVTDAACALCHAGGGSANPPAHVDGVVQLDLEGVACEICHGTPPPPRHPSADLPCGDCHAPGGSGNPDLHPDGVVQLDLTGLPCTTCHGSAATDAAPPVDTYGRNETALLSVGAHRTHIDGTASSAAVPCDTCHLVPVTGNEPGHVDPGPAEVLDPVGYAGVPSTCTNACHDGPGAANPAPDWTVVDGTEAECGDCHGLPPPYPHPNEPACADCHSTAGPDFSIAIPEQHVDGRLDF